MLLAARLCEVHCANKPVDSPIGAPIVAIAQETLLDVSSIHCGLRLPTFEIAVFQTDTSYALRTHE